MKLATASRAKGSLVKRLLIGVAVYLVIGLIWSLSQFAQPAQTKRTDSQAGQPGLGVQAASVGIGTVLWLPLVIISSFSD